MVLRSFFSYQVAVEPYQQIQLSFGVFIVPGHVYRFLPSGLTQILALYAMGRTQQMLQEILMALAAGPQNVGAPDKKIARPVERIVRIVAGKL